MIEAICWEIESRKNEVNGQIVETIYFGGGTPSLLKEEELILIFSTINKNYSVNPKAEITLEANPDDINLNQLLTWKKVGINRLSVGLQSFREKDLVWMNRAHSAKESLACLELTKQVGGHSLSVDLIYGLPDLSLKDWELQIQNVINYGVEHISAYCLTVEEKTVLAKKVSEGKINPSNEDEQAEQYSFLVDKLRGAGYEQYEVSNFCLPGNEAKHNSSYWKNVTYQGFGPSAHGFDGKKRRFNVANNPLYLKYIKNGGKYYDDEILSDVDQFNELILTGLRTKWGVSLSKLTMVKVPSQLFYTRIKEFSDKNWVKVENNTLFLIDEGWLMADYISSELFEE